MALGLFAIGYTRLARDLPHAATSAALLTHGLGRTVGGAAAFVAVLSYNCVQIGLCGLLGGILAGQLGGAWWGWALVAWAVEAVIGYRGVTLGASVVAVVLVLELGMIVLFDVTALTHPAQTDVGAWLQPWRSDLLAVDGVGGVLAFGVAAFLGFETAAAFGEEVRSERSVGRATWTCLAFLGPSLADPSGIAPVLLPLLVVVAALAETRILLFEPARDHLPEPPDIPSDRPADPDRVDPLRPDPVRHAVVDRLAVAGRRHSRYRAERSARAGRPGPHAIVFLFRESEPDAQDRVTVATRMFVDGPDVADLPAVLAALHGRLRRTENPWIPT